MTTWFFLPLVSAQTPWATFYYPGQDLINVPQNQCVNAFVSEWAGSFSAPFSPVTNKFSCSPNPPNGGVYSYSSVSQCSSASSGSYVGGAWVYDVPECGQSTCVRKFFRAFENSEITHLSDGDSQSDPNMNTFFSTPSGAFSNTPTAIILLDLTVSNAKGSSTDGYAVSTVYVDFVRYPPSEVRVYRADNQEGRKPGISPLGTSASQCVGSQRDGYSCKVSGTPSQCCLVGLVCLERVETSLSTCQRPDRSQNKGTRMAIPLTAATGVNYLVVEADILPAAGNFNPTEMSVCLKETFSWAALTKWDTCTVSACGSTGSQYRVYGCRGTQTKHVFPDEYCVTPRPTGPGQDVRSCIPLVACPAPLGTPPVIGAPTGLTVRTGLGFFRFEWTAPVGTVSGYEIAYGAGTTTVTSGPTVVESQVSYNYETTATAGFFQVIPLDVGGAYGNPVTLALSAPVAPVRFNVGNLPSNVVVSESDGALLVSFTGIVQPEYGFRGYQIILKSCYMYRILSVVTVATTTATVSVQNGVGYRVSVRAVAEDAQGQVTYGTPVDAMRQIPASAIPAANTMVQNCFVATKPGQVAWRYSECSGACGQGPALQVGSYSKTGTCESAVAPFTTYLDSTVCARVLPAVSFSSETCIKMCPKVPTNVVATAYKNGALLTFVGSDPLLTNSRASYRVARYYAVSSPAGKELFGQSNGPEARIFVSGLKAGAYTFSVFAELVNENPTSSLDRYLYSEKSTSTASVSITDTAACFFTCQNGGQCVDGECRCPRGFTGPNCESTRLSIVVANPSAVLYSSFSLLTSNYYSADFSWSSPAPADFNPIEILFFKQGECANPRDMSADKICIPVASYVNQNPGSSVGWVFNDAPDSVYETLDAGSNAIVGWTVLWYASPELTNVSSLQVTRSLNCTAQRPCGANQECELGYCKCKENFQSATQWPLVCVADQKCPVGMCGDYGTCQPADGTCKCDPTYKFTGSRCEYAPAPTCNLRCKNGYLATTPMADKQNYCTNDLTSFCRCQGSYTGRDCSVCSIRCQHGGTPKDGKCYECTCPRFWMGDECENPYFELTVYFNVAWSRVSAVKAKELFIAALGKELGTLGMGAIEIRDVMAGTKPNTIAVVLRVPGINAAVFQEEWTTQVRLAQANNNDPTAAVGAKFTRFYFLNRADLDSVVQAGRGEVAAVLSAASSFSLAAVLLLLPLLSFSL